MNTRLENPYKLKIMKQAPDVLDIEDVLKLLDLPEYDSLSESNWETIEDRALWNYAYHKGYDFKPESWSMTKECELCDGEGMIESGDECPLCDGEGRIGLDIDELRDSAEYEESYADAEKPLYEGWQHAVERVLDVYMEYHHLTAHPVKIPGYYQRDGKQVRWLRDGWRIKPAYGHTWKHVAQALQDTNSGYGWGYDHTALELMQSFRESTGAHASYKQAVIANLSVMTVYGEVYDVKSPARLYESELSTNLYNW